VPSTSRRQQKFMRAEYGRASRGEKTQTGMSLGQLGDFTELEKPTKKKRRKRGKR